jgi:hypothetical protein
LLKLFSGALSIKQVQPQFLLVLQAESMDQPIDVSEPFHRLREGNRELGVFYDCVLTCSDFNKLAVVSSTAEWV